MEISIRDLLTVMHGMGFGALFMLAFSGAIGELYWISAPGVRSPAHSREQRLLSFYLIAMVVLAWATVITGAYIIYPWYRAVPPSSVADLSAYPQAFLKSSPYTAGWHDLGMEWKENVAWLAPISMTMVAYVTMTYRSAVGKMRDLRIAVLTFAVIAFVATGIAGAFGAFLNKYAPVRGGTEIHIVKEK
jgi:uncharacterized membrane protein